MNVVRRPDLVSVVLLALAVGYGGYSFGRALLGPKQGLDFAQYYIAARAVYEGEDAAMYLTGEAYQEKAAEYGVRPVLDDTVMTNAYPPVVGLIFLPFGALPFGGALVAFLLVSLGAALLSVPILFSDRPPERRKRLIVAGWALIFIFFPSHFTWYMGQGNFILLLCLALVLHYTRRDRVWLVGLFLALAILIKLFPVLLFPFFVLKRQLRPIGTTLAWLVVLTGASFLVIEPQLYGTFFSEVLGREAWSAGHHRDQSFAGFLSRLLTHNAVVPPVADLPQLARNLTDLLRLGVLLVAAWATRRRVTRGTGRWEIEFGLWLAAILPALPKAWEHYAVLLLIPYFFLFELIVFDLPRESRTLFIAALSFCIWSFVLTTGLEYSVLPKHVILQPIYSAKLIATLALLGCCISILRRRDPALDAVPRFRAAVA